MEDMDLGLLLRSALSIQGVLIELESHLVEELRTHLAEWKCIK